MNIFISSDNGQISLGALQITWGNELGDLDLPGFFAFTVGSWSLEMGDVDQGLPGIYLIRYIYGEPFTVRTFWKA